MSTTMSPSGPLLDREGAIAETDAGAPQFRRVVAIEIAHPDDQALRIVLRTVALSTPSSSGERQRPFSSVARAS